MNQDKLEVIHNDLRWIPHQNGKLAYYLDDNGGAVLCDYIGTDTVLFLPRSLDDGLDEIPVSGTIPDESFQSCHHIKIIVFDFLSLPWEAEESYWNIGSFVFPNCSDLKCLLSITSHYRDDDEVLREKYSGFGSSQFSFVDCDYLDKELPEYTLDLYSYDWLIGSIEEDILYRFADKIMTNHIELELIELLSSPLYSSRVIRAWYDADDKGVDLLVKKCLDLKNKRSAVE